MTNTTTYNIQSIKNNLAKLVGRFVLKNEPLMQISNLIKEEHCDCAITGGFIRDLVIKMERLEKNLYFFDDKIFLDIDIATNANVSKIAQKISQNNKISVCKMGDHVLQNYNSVLLTSGNLKIHITQTRLDIESDGRHSKVQTSSSFLEDSKRRDFRCNSIYVFFTKYDQISDLDVFDYQKGISNIISKKIMFIGKIESRIKEDYLRILRMIRFSSQLGFKIYHTSLYAKNIIKLMSKNIVKLVSKERISEEVLKSFNYNLINSVFLMKKFGIYENLFDIKKSDVKCLLKKNNPKIKLMSFNEKITLGILLIKSEGGIVSFLNQIIVPKFCKNLIIDFIGAKKIFSKNFKKMAFYLLNKSSKYKSILEILFPNKNHEIHKIFSFLNSEQKIRGDKILNLSCMNLIEKKFLKDAILNVNFLVYKKLNQSNYSTNSNKEINLEKIAKIAIYNLKT